MAVKPAKKKEGAPEGNKNAEKWTREEVMPLLEQIEAEAQKDDCYYIGSALVAVRLYKDVWQYWKDKFKEDIVVFRTIKTIEQIFEAKLFAGALSSKVNNSVAIFGLKNNHDWKDKSEVDTNMNVAINWEEKKNYDKK